MTEKRKLTFGDVMQNTAITVVLAIVITAFMVLLGLLFVDVLLSVTPKLIQEWRHLVEVWNQP